MTKTTTTETTTTKAKTPQAEVREAVRAAAKADRERRKAEKAAPKAKAAAAPEAGPKAEAAPKAAPKAAEPATKDGEASPAKPEAAPKAAAPAHPAKKAPAKAAEDGGEEERAAYGTRPDEVRDAHRAYMAARRAGRKARLEEAKRREMVSQATTFKAWVAWEKRVSKVIGCEHGEVLARVIADGVKSIDVEVGAHHHAPVEATA
jgi:hypothetical protein